MTFVRLGLLLALILCIFASGLAAQSPGYDDTFTISVVKPTLAKDVQVRFLFSAEPSWANGVQVRYLYPGERPGQGSSNPVDGNKIVMKTGPEPNPAKSFRLIAYAPGCQFVTLTVDDLADSDRQGDFQCQKLPTIQLHGRVDATNLGQRDYLGQREWQIEALYVCSWAMSYFGVGGGSVSPLTVGKARVARDGSFTLELPDFTADPTWPRISKDAEFSFFLKDPTANERVGPLVVPASHTGNLQVAPSYPEVILEIPEM